MDRDEEQVEMKILAARFPDVVTANAVLADLRQRYDLGDEDALVGPLGSTDYEEPQSGTVLAGRFRADRLADVERLVVERGGEVVVETEERVDP
ncbi:MAG: hypothetical protein ACJ77N_12095 [Chloroflexota bacterium]